jgi:hypothetical protein
MTESAKEKRYVQLNEVATNDPNMAMSPTFRRLRLESMDISWADKQKIIKEAEQMAQQQAQMAQEEMALEREKIAQGNKDRFDIEEQQANTAKSKMEAFANIIAE